MPRIFRSFATYVAALIGIAGVLTILYAWNLPPFASSVQTTNDAYVRGRVTMMSPQLSGIVAEVPVQDFQHVTAGTLIARIDDGTYRQKLEQARANLSGQEAALSRFEQQRLSAEAKVTAAEAAQKSAEASFDTADANWNRIAPLAAKGFAPGSDLDLARKSRAEADAALNQARAQVEVARQDLASVITSRQSLEAAVDSAKAAVSLAELDMTHTRIVAPADGTLGEVGVRVGQYVQPGTGLASLVPDDRWIVANFKETQVRGMAPGQRVDFTVDAYPGRVFHGQVERFSPATGSEFAVLKSDNATGNFTKIAQRMPVRIRIDGQDTQSGRLVPGMSVIVSIDTAQPMDSLAADADGGGDSAGRIE